MILTFGNTLTSDIYHGENTKRSRRFPSHLHGKARRLLDQINAAQQLKDLSVPPGNRLEALSGSLKGFHSVRINDQWRIIFRWLDGRCEDVEITDYH